MHFDMPLDRCRRCRDQTDLVSVFVDSRRVGDRTGLSDPVDDASEVYVMQALSGG